MPTRILICDDSSFSRKMIARALPEELDVAVAQTASGEQAVSACLAGEADLLLLDLNMPGLDGFDVLRRLSEVGFDRPVVVITANIQTAPMQRARNLGARAVLNKPVDAARLQELVRYLRKEGSL